MAYVNFHLGDEEIFGPKYEEEKKAEEEPL